MNSVLRSFSPSYGSRLQDEVDFIIVDREDDDMDEYLNEEDEHGNSSLIFACLENNSELARNLIDQGAFVNHQNKAGETAIYWASAQGSEEILEILIENGANLNICNVDGVSAAHVASANGHRNIVEKLARNGAFINAQDEVKDSVLHYAVREGKTEIVEFLIRKCMARVDIYNDDYESPLDLALCLEPTCGKPYDNIVKILQSSLPNGYNSTSNPSSSPSKKMYNDISIYGGDGNARAHQGQRLVY